MTHRGIRIALSAALALLVLGVVWALPQPAGAQDQARGGVTFQTDDWDIAVEGFWYKPGDSSQDGSRARPFGPGWISMSLTINGYDISGDAQTALTFMAGDADPKFGGVALNMGNSSWTQWPLEGSETTNVTAHLDVSARITEGGLATWAYRDAKLKLERNGQTEIIQIPKFGGSFYLGSAPVVDSTELESARLLAEQTAAQAKASAAVADRKKERANKLVKRLRSANRQHEQAVEKLEQATARHATAVEEAERLAQRAIDRGPKAQQRADEAAARAERLSNRVANRAEDVEAADQKRSTAKNKADHALGLMKAAIAQAQLDAQAAQAAADALAKLESQ